MGRTSIKNKLILCFLALILIVMLVVTVVNLMTEEFILAQAISTAFALAVGILVGSLFSRSLVFRLNSLSQAAREISEGDLTRQIKILSQDEVRGLEEIFSLMLKQLREMLYSIHDVSVQIKAANTTLIGLTKKLMENSREIDVCAKEIAKGSEAQTGIVQKTALKIENNIGAMEKLIRQSSETVGSVGTALEKTRAGSGKARETLQYLEEVLGDMRESAKPMFKLAQKIDKIKVIIGVMDNISQKTDLLSLNASIEATRAGEYGRGFAMVADEIRTMAESSKQSSREITRLIEDILEDNQEVVESLGKNQEDINKGHEIIHGIVDTFEEMLGGVGEIIDAVRNMEKETGEQMVQMRGLSEFFQRLSKLATENVISTQKTTRAIDNQNREVSKIVKAVQGLNRLSQKMIQTQSQFTLPERSS